MATTYIDDLKTARDALSAALAAARAVPDYNLDGQAFQRSKFISDLVKDIAALTELIARQEPYQVETRSVF